MGDPEGLRQRASRPVEKQSDHETEAQLTVNKPVENVNNYRKLLFLTILSTAGTFALVGFQLFSRDGGTGSAHQFLFFYIIVPFTILLYILLFCINTHPINSVFLIMILCINSLALGVLLQTSFQPSYDRLHFQQTHASQRLICLPQDSVSFTTPSLSPASAPSDSATVPTASLSTTA